MTPHEKDGQAAWEGLSDEEIRMAEDHRAFVREVDSAIGKAYGSGGGLVVALLLMCMAGGWWMGVWSEAWMWTATVTVVLGAIYGVRRWIYGRREKWHQKVEAYCEANQLESQVLAAYFDGQQLYPFFATLYEPSARERLEAEANQAGAK